MKKLAAFYFSGTGNTRYVTARLCQKLSSVYQTGQFDISERNDFADALGNADCILLAFPVYGSSPPVPMRRFLFRYAKLFQCRDIIIAATQYMFSGDGAASLGRTVEKLGGNVVYAEHFRMPNNLSDCKIFKIQNGKELTRMLRRTDKRIDRFADKIISGTPLRRGFNPLSHAIGYLSQRALWRRHENEKKKCLKINADLCSGCGVCARKCPVNNITMKGAGKKVACPNGECALCYRCVNLCPHRAITLVGKEPPFCQYKGPES